MKDGEVVLRLVANYTFKCAECHGYIEAGQTFLCDKIPYFEGSGIYRRKTVRNHNIHEWHWRGPTDKIIDCTKRKRGVIRDLPYESP